MRSQPQIWHGVVESPQEMVPVKAGSVEAVVVGADLRYVRLGGVEVAQRIYVGVRDAVWNTIPPTLRDVEIIQGSDHFAVHFVARHQYADIDYEWTGTMEGQSDGTITCAMDGIAHADFTHAKIGFNVHHPLPEYVGRTYRARTPDGIVEGRFPEHIDPQLVRDGTLTAMFEFFDRLEVDLSDSVTARFDFEGDMFEVQDHRNWCDANFKTYGTPLSFGFPMQVEEGARFRQVVRLCASGPGSRPQSTKPVEVHVGRGTGRSLPLIGLGMGSYGDDLADEEASLVALAAPAHLRVDILPSDEGHVQSLERSVRAAQRLDCGLEVAVFVSPDAERELEDLARRLGVMSVPVHRVLIFEHSEGFSEMRGATSPAVVAAAQQILRPAVGKAPIAGGTNQFFTEINRDRPDATPMDGIAFSLNPQVHAADDLSLIENIAAEGDVIASVRALYEGLSIFVTPVTLIGRNGPFPGGPPDPLGLPGPVDPRQASLLGAGWTLGSVRGFAAAGVSALTYFETSGWRGIAERQSGNERPDLFPAKAGEAYPMLHVFADLAELGQGELLDTTISDPRAATALAVASEDGFHILLANLTSAPQRLWITGLGDAGTLNLRTLDDTCADRAMSHPGAFRSSQPSRVPSDGDLHLILAPYAYVRMDG